MRALKTAIVLKSLTCGVFVWEQPVGQWSSVLYPPPAAAVNELLIRGGSVTARLDQSFRWIHQSLVWQRHRGDLHKLGRTQTGDQQGDEQLHPEFQETVNSKVLLVFCDRGGSGLKFEVWCRSKHFLQSNQQWVEPDPEDPNTDECLSLLCLLMFESKG